MTPRCLVCGDEPRFCRARCRGCYDWNLRHGKSAPVLLEALLATQPDAVTVLRVQAVLNPTPALLRFDSAAEWLRNGRGEKRKF